MSNYYVHRSGEDEYLEHSIFQKGVRGSHKYIARMNIGGKMRYFYDPRELAVFKAGGRALGGARKAVGGAGKAVGGAIANVRRNASSFVDRHITGASAKRAASAERKRWKTQESNYNNSGARSRATRAKKNSEAYERKYNKSLFGRIENAGKRIANAGSSARTAVGNAAGQAAKAGKNFAGSVSKEAYRTARKTKRKVKGLITPKKAPRKPAKEVNVRDYAKIDRKNEKSAEQYQYFDKDAGWATNSLAAAKRLSGHKSHNRKHAARNRKRGRNAVSRSTR